MSALEKAISRAGNATKLAKKLGLSSMAISHWKKRYNGVIPSEHVLPIFNLTGVTPMSYGLTFTQIQPMDYRSSRIPASPLKD